MTAAALLETCARHGVSLAVEGDALRVRGPRPVRDELLPKIRELKPQLLAMLKRSALRGATAAAPTTTAPRAPKPFPDGPGHEWHRDWRGQWVNLFGLRPTGGSDAPN